MKFYELSEIQIQSFLTALLRFSYPLYCVTGVTDYDYHFIGSCFPIRKDDRFYFVFTDHQSKVALGSEICVAFPESDNRVLQVKQSGIRRFKKSDLAIFEYKNDEDTNDFHALNSSLFASPTDTSQHEYAVLGCQTELNVVDHDSKKITVRKGALITDVADMSPNAASIKLDLSLCRLVAPSNYISDIQSFTAATQGLSGSPILAFKIIDTDEQGCNLDLHIVGVTTHVAVSDKILFGTRALELMACLHHGFNVFPELIAK